MLESAKNLHLALSAFLEYQLLQHFPLLLWVFRAKNNYENAKILQA